MRLPHFDSNLFSSTLLSSGPSKEAAAFMPLPSSCNQHADRAEKQAWLNEQVLGGAREERLANGDEVAIIRGAQLYATAAAAAGAV